MKKMIAIRNNVIIILCITIISLGIGFMVLSVKLKSEKEKENSFDVSFITIDKTSSVRGSSKEPIGKSEIINSGKEISMEFHLNAVHDELSYVAVIKNNGTLPALLVDVLESPDYSSESFSNIISPVEVTISDIKGKTILPGEEVELRIVVYYNPTSSIVTSKDFTYKIGLITKSK